MKVFAINSSARVGGESKTELILNQLIKGMEEEGGCYFAINNNEIHYSLESAAKPDITITTPFELWMDIVTKKADWAQMFMAQKYKVEGDINLLMKMG